MKETGGLTVLIFLGVAGENVLFGLLMIAISEVLTALERICNNIADLSPDSSAGGTPGNSGNLSVYESSFNSAEALNKLSAIASGQQYSVNTSAGGWVCPACGKANRSFEEICSCGEPKNKNNGENKDNNSHRELTLFSTLPKDYF